jgi:TRAP transporter TAXI family solute receptor
VRLVTGQRGGGFHPFGAALADLLNQGFTEATVDVIPTDGAVSNVEAIQSGQADVGFAFADVAYLAFTGLLDGHTPPYDQLRAIAVLQLTPVQLFTRPDSGIRSVNDLRGRLVAVGPEGSGTALTARLIFQAFGIAPTEVRTQTLTFSDAGERLIRGEIDAMFDTAIHPAESATLAVRAGARLIPIGGTVVSRLRREYPFLRQTVVPAGTYPGVDVIETVGVDSLLVCRRALDEHLVHELTARLFQALPQLSLSRRIHFAELDEASTTPIPLHDGAARYYREQELLR